jgi:hypothetical protein
MPRATKTPYFAGLPDEPIADFLFEYSELADGHRLTEKQQVETIIQYIPFSLKDLWRSLGGYKTGNWMVFSSELERLYPDMDAETCYTRQGLMDIVNLSARTQMHDEKDVLDYYRHFLAISNPLHTANLILVDKHNAEFLHGFHPYDRSSISNCLYTLHLHRPCNKPYELNDVFTVACGYFADLQLYRPVQYPEDPSYQRHVDPSGWPQQPPGEDRNSRRYNHKPIPHQRDRDFAHDFGTQHTHDLLHKLTTQRNCNLLQSQPDPPKAEYKTRTVHFTNQPPKPSTQEDNNLEDMVLKMHNLLRSRLT